MPQPKPVSDVLVHEEDGQAFLLHVATGRYFGLNRTGVVVWEALVAGADPVTALRAAWPGVPPATCEADVRTLLDALATAGLVTAGGDGAPTP